MVKRFLLRVSFHSEVVLIFLLFKAIEPFMG